MIPFLDFGGSGPPLFFSHANGYPPQAYTPLLNALTSRQRVRAIQFRPLWPGAQPNGLRDWNPFVDDVMQWLDEQAETNVIGVGHSLGAIATLAAALRRPELFRAVVLLDPVLLYRRLSYVWTLLRKLGLAHVAHPLIPSAKCRRRIFCQPGGNVCPLPPRARPCSSFAANTPTRFIRPPCDRCWRVCPKPKSSPCPTPATSRRWKSRKKLRDSFTSFYRVIRS